MRNLTKNTSPQVLTDNVTQWTQDYLGNPASGTYKYRYREASIKQALKAETGDKCIYCESKIGHNTPGDVEHMIPSSASPQMHFQWNNLTIACGECNRRKNDYNDLQLPFLNPYIDDVESMVTHLGPIVSWRVGQQRAESTLRIFELHNPRRIELIKRKIEHIETINDKLARVNQEIGVLKELLILQIEEMQQVSSEYSGMVKAIVEGVS